MKSLSAYEFVVPKDFLIEYRGSRYVMGYLKNKGVQPQDVTSIVIKDRKNLREMPGWIFSLTPHVKKIAIINCAISRVPSGIGKLQQLESLDLHRNRIKEVHPNIQKIKSLRTLVLSRNALEDIPKGVYNMPWLKVLDVCFNKIHQLDNAGMRKLRNTKVYSGFNKAHTLLLGPAGFASPRLKTQTGVHGYN